MKDKIAAIHKLLSGWNRVLIALSGGVDSAVLLKLTTDCLTPGNVLAVTIRSATATSAEMAMAAEIAGLCAVNHRFITTDELAIPEFAANPVNRCYHCQRHRFGLLTGIAFTEGYEAVLDGSNESDQGDYRPGQLALRELGIRSPLKECAINKEDIRQLAKQFLLPNRNRPANACLASRLPYGTPVSKEALNQIAAGEEVLRTAGFTQCRLRHHGNLARLEIFPEEFAGLLETERRDTIINSLKRLGYTYITMDLQGYRTGSLNETLKEELR